MQVRHAAAMAAAALTAGAVLGTPAAAVAVTAGTHAAVAQAADADAAAAREFVLWLAEEDDRALVRSTAWAALLDGTGDAAIKRFLDSEYFDAEQLATESSARNADFVAYVLETYSPTYAPEVHAAARRAAAGTDSLRETFVLTGYPAAKKRDRQVRDAAGQQAAALVMADRDFVAALCERDPGAQVRATAAWALRDGAVDGDVVEFFSYGWANAAGLDLRAHRTALVHNDVRWRRVALRLIVDAQAAEKAAREAAGEAAVQAREAARRAWRAAGEQSGPARVAWAEAQTVALTQADTWQRIAQAAAGASSPNWTPIQGTAAQMRSEWAVEQGQAAVQAAYWTGLHEQALASERALQTPPG